MSGPDSDAEICKWVDEKGVTHFADVCPENADAESVTVEKGPTEEQLRAARLRSQALQAQRDKPVSSPHTDMVKVQSLPLEALGPLPEQARSQYLRTSQASVLVESLNGQENVRPTARFILTLQATYLLPEGSLIEVQFPDAGNPDRTTVDSKVMRRQGASLTFLSPPSGNFRCWNYPVKVLVYADESRETQIGTHEQLIQSRFDLPLLNEHPNRLEGWAQGGACPSEREKEMYRMSVEQLKALCEAAREKHLAPERRKLVSECVQKGKSRDYCERYFADWGDARRLSRATVRSALYYDLPECLAWKEAAEESP